MPIPTVQRLDTGAASLPQLDSLLVTDLSAPMAHLRPAVEPDDWLAARHSQLGTLAEHPEVRGWLAGTPAEPLALVQCRDLGWDTEQLARRCARLVTLLAVDDYPVARCALDTLLARVLVEERERGLEYLTARVSSSDSAVIHALERAGFETIDGILTFMRHLEKRPVDPAGPGEIRLVRDEDVEQVIALAGIAYRIDRFHADPLIDGATADRLHEVWLRNSCTGEAAEAVVVVREGSDLLGFVTCQIDRSLEAVLGSPVGIIVLVATSEKARRRGVGAAATSFALGWFWDRGVRTVQVGTQHANIGASRLYEAVGFRLAASSLTLRRAWEA